jgi:hypothetical protein
VDEILFDGLVKVDVPLAREPATPAAPWLDLLLFAMLYLAPESLIPYLQSPVLKSVFTCYSIARPLRSPSAAKQAPF